MNIDDITLGQFKSLQAVLGGNAPTKGSALTSHLVGKYVIIRSRNEGINAGTISAIDETGVILDNARRIWYHKPKVVSESWYEGVANHGLSSDSKVSAAVKQKAIIEDYSVTVCTSDAQKSIEAQVAHAQS